MSKINGIAIVSVSHMLQEAVIEAILHCLSLIILKYYVYSSHEWATAAPEGHQQAVWGQGGMADSDHDCNIGARSSVGT